MARKNEYHYWLYEHRYDTVGSFFEYVTSLIKKNNIRLNILLVATRRNIEEVLTGWSPEQFAVRIKNSLPVLSLEITKTIDSRDTTVKALAIEFSTDYPVYLIMSDCKAEDFKEIISRVLSKHYPEVSQIFITNGEMRSIFDKLHLNTELQIQVESSVSKKRIAGNKKESQVTYTNFPYQEVFDEIIAHDRWIQSIRYVAQKVEYLDNVEFRTNKFSGIITRNCFFSIRGDFSPLIQIIIPMAISLGSLRHKYLQSRAETASQKKPEPVVVKFQKEIFSDLTRNKHYVDMLAELESCSVSEYHSNPYMHLSMLDYLDGSSYDIWVVSTNRMVIIPHFKASAASMSRLVNHIFERINEGEVEKYEQVQANSQY